ncbi:MAG: ribonuclease H-like domain-containing protein [Anaerolineales bacterium]|nr:ribonuclease H-like domain-containing protein [Anaerolineales bacterium]
MPAADLRTRLQRLRVHQHRTITTDSAPPVGPAQADTPSGSPPARTIAPAPRDLGNALPGERVESSLGAFQRVDTVYDLGFTHGPKPLAEAFAYPAATAARLARDEALAQTDLRSLAFLDTETTGLAGGAGTLVFLIGVGAVHGDQFVLRQYFLLDPAHEPALLDALIADLAPRTGYVTFNGRSFDLPLLETRLTVNRRRGALGHRPHLDLLMPARRLYRGRLPSCALGDIERGVFNIARQDDDVPGWLIPQLYHDYLRTGDARAMQRVIYHNTVDILSMVTLTAQLLETFGAPRGGDAGRSRPGAMPARAAREAAPPGPSPADLLRLACWHADNDRPAEAEAAFQGALAGQLTLPDRTLGLTRLAALYKKLDRRAEAVPYWEQLASFTLEDPLPFVELAKYYEWRAHDYRRAQVWVQRALALVGGWPAGWQRQAAVEALHQRLARVRAKQGPEAA